MDIETIAKSLTKAQATIIVKLTGEWTMAPYDGWRRAGQACTSLVKPGLVEKSPPGTRFADAPAYRLTALGVQVAATAIRQMGEG